jgi:hypothetical protein
MDAQKNYVLRSCSLVLIYGHIREIASAEGHGGGLEGTFLVPSPPELKKGDFAVVIGRLRPGARA